MLKLKNVNKKYNSFHLKDISFCCPEGSIMGLIGQNGAGKTTIINLILNLIKLDSGMIKIFGEDINDLSFKRKDEIAVVHDMNCLPENLSPKELEKIFKKIYTNWDSIYFFNNLKKMNIPEKSIRKMSRGNQMKTNLLIALSHNPRLLILDEITATLDPIMRKEVFNIFLEFIKNKKNSILFSSHVITELEKITDYITFVNNGELIFSESKKNLFLNYLIFNMSKQIFQNIEKKYILAFHEDIKEKNIRIVIHSEYEKEFVRSFKASKEKTTLDDLFYIFAKGQISCSA